MVNAVEQEAKKRAYFTSINLHEKNKDTVAHTRARAHAFARRRVRGRMESEIQDTVDFFSGG